MAQVLETASSSSAANRRLVFPQGPYSISVLVEARLMVLAAFDTSIKRSRVSFFMDEVVNVFVERFGAGIWSAEENSLDNHFGRVLKNKMAYYTSDPSVDPTGKIAREVDEVQVIMRDNIDKVIERGEKVDVLVEKTRNLEHESITFKQRSTKLKVQERNRNYKLWFIIACVLLVIIALAVVFPACGGFELKKCI